MDHTDPVLQPKGPAERLKECNRSMPLAWALSGGIFVLMLVLNILTPYICDDFTYYRNFSTGNPLGSLLEIPASMYAHSYKMNGRLISHGLAQVFMLLPPLVFDVCNATVFAGTVYLIHRLCAGERNGLLLAAAFCLLWSAMPVFGQVALWQVGALNYFWSLTALVLFITPALLRFLQGRELLRNKWQWALFCICGFFFGWYSEIASFVGICMVICLIMLDVWMNRRKWEFYRFLPVITAVLGYLVMLSMPAQMANKQGAELTVELLELRFSVCNDMLLEYLLPLLILFAIGWVWGLFAHLPGKLLTVSALFALAGVCANYMPLAASYYPERCLCVPALMLVMANLFLLAQLGKGKTFALFSVSCLLAVCLTIPGCICGCQDIASCHQQHLQREQTISEALENGERNVTANTVIPATGWSGYWGVRDLTDDPTTWPNYSMALYYGLDSLTAE